MRRKTHPGPPESVIQMAVARYLDHLGVLWTHCPNGGQRSIVTAKRLRAEGLKAGVPDILIFTRPPKVVPARGAAIELKREKGGRLSPDQKQWLKDLEDNGWVTAVCCGLDEALAVLKDWGYGR